YAENIESIKEHKVRVRRRLEHGVETIEASLPVLITVNGSALPCRPRNAKLLQKYKHARTVTERQTENIDYIDIYSVRPYLNLVEWGVTDVGADVELCGLSGSPTKVKKIENVSFQAKENKRLSESDEDINELMKELIENHTIG
ncbi:MAG: electron transfer flavoprotein beta subunit/FixA family protein, partial [Dysgonamonadaceae bacterium]